MNAENKELSKYNFKKGVSGNPGGRPKRSGQELDLINACKSKSSEALDTLIDIMKNGGERNRITAAIAIIERGYGKAVQPTDMNLSGALDNRIEVVIIDHKS